MNDKTIYLEGVNVKLEALAEILAQQVSLEEVLDELRDFYGNDEFEDWYDKQDWTA